MIEFEQLLNAQKIGQIPDPYLIAEAGVNHEGSMDLAKQLIDEAQEGGANAIKFQSYKAHLIASKNSPAYWDTSKEKAKNQYELFKRYDAFWKPEYEELKRHCEQVGIEFMSTPFDLESANFLDELVSVHKISSSDITNQPLLESIGSKKKPILLSTGAATISEISRAASFLEKYGAPVCLMHCILNYPTPDKNANLGMIVDLKNRFPNTLIGYSDHTLPGDMENLLLASMLGASVLEKHFSHDKTLPGNDHYHAMDMTDLKHFKARVRRAQEIIGSYEKTPLSEEGESRKQARRSLVSAHPIAIGETITKESLISKRPAHGISPFEIDKIAGTKAKIAIEEDTIISWDMLSV
ncbi:MAG: acetylneuraminic acid synthetase [Gammaproteobacteria bacterium]|nr:acetylneuraminic acid synthetase [Gammaproteobacteria bacterium]